MNLGRPGARPFFVRIFVSMVLAVFLAQLGVVVLAVLTMPAQPRVFSVAEVGRALASGVDRSERLEVEIGTPPGPATGDPAQEGIRRNLAEIAGTDRQRVRVRRTQPLLPFAAAVDRSPTGGALDRLFGGFEAAVQLPDGRWRVVTPASSNMTQWPARMLLWIAATMIVVAPIAWLLARRLAAPIGMFVAAAERLGKDPRAPSIPVEGPAEVREAAGIFNQMQERLQRYVQDRTMMIAAIAHDLRTPMLRMRFKLEKIPEEPRASIAEDLNEMNEMIGSVLSFMRELQGAGARQKLELRSAIESVADDLVDLGADVEIEPGPPIVAQADPLGMRALFRNLIGNAVQYGGRVRIRMHAGDAIEVVIDDDGPGIPEQELERVFEPFYRAEPSRSRDTGGTGLGLATVRTIARAHGGDVKLANRDEGGLRAIVTLPA